MWIPRRLVLVGICALELAAWGATGGTPSGQVGQSNGGETPSRGPTKAADWNQVVHDAQKEGTVVVYGPPGSAYRPVLVDAFQKAYPRPVAAAFGGDPLLFVAGSQGLPISTNEFEWAGAVKGEPIEVIKGPVTGLPLPAMPRS